MAAMRHISRSSRSARCSHTQPGGVFLCEDIHGESHAFHTYVDRLTRPLHQVNLNDLGPRPIHQHVQSVHRYPILTVIENPPSGVPRFDAPRHGTHWEPFLDHLLPSDREQEPDDPR